VSEKMVMVEEWRWRCGRRYCGVESDKDEKMYNALRLDGERRQLKT